MIFHKYFTFLEVLHRCFFGNVTDRTPQIFDISLNNVFTILSRFHAVLLIAALSLLAIFLCRWAVEDLIFYCMEVSKWLLKSTEHLLRI